MKYLNTYNQLNEDSNQLNEESKLKEKLSSFIRSLNGLEEWDYVYDYMEQFSKYDDYGISDLVQIMTSDDIKDFFNSKQYKDYLIYIKTKDFNL